MTAIAGALATRFDASLGLVRQHLVHADIEEWGKVRRIDSDAGDTMQASSLRVARDDTRDATHVRVRTMAPCIVFLLIVIVLVRDAC
jgi:hypothetical protein